MTDKSPAHLLRLGTALREERERTGLTQAEVATKLGCTQGKIQKIETKPVSVSEIDLDRMIDLYQVPPDRAGELRDFARAIRRGKPAGFSAKWSPFAQLSALEVDAAEIYCLHGERIPGPLQSEQYMLQQHPDANMTPDVASGIRLRKSRGQLFAGKNPPYYRVILSESALLRMPGGWSPKLAVDQVEYLIELMVRYERLEIQILPLDSPARFVNNDFQILRFEGNVADFAYLEWAGGSRVLKRPAELKGFQEHWQELHKLALSRDRTLEFLVDFAARSTQATIDSMLFSKRKTVDRPL